MQLNDILLDQLHGVFGFGVDDVKRLRVKSKSSDDCGVVYTLVGQTVDPFEIRREL